MRKMISKHVFIFENGGGLDSDAAAPPPATASEMFGSPEKKLHVRCFSFLTEREMSIFVWH
jgi:hypothetical protein